MTAFLGTTLTARQWEVVRYRASGMTQATIAKKLNTTRVNVSEIEHRARLNINAAKATIAALQEIHAAGEVLVPTDTSIFEVVSMIILRADILGVKLQGTADDVLATIRARWKAKIKGHRLTAATKVEIKPDGSLSFRTAD